MERYKTISRNDPEFTRLLDGSFSSAYRALPQRSLNVGTGSEIVTFEIVPISEIQRPALPLVLWQAARPQTLAFSAGPMLASFFYSWARGFNVDFLIALSSFIGILCFHFAVNLFNDYGDHLKGRDRIRPRGGSRVLQRGWISASSLKFVAWGLMAAAAVLGLPAILFSSSGLPPMLMILVLAGLVGLEFAFQKLRLKSRGLTEVLGFALTGPFLVGGFTWAITGRIGFEDGAIGCVFGALSLMYFHSVNFENIMTDSQAGVRTWATRAGFDASKRFFFFTAALALACMIAFVLGFAQDLRLLPPIVALGAVLFPMVKRVHLLASPLSSQLVDLRQGIVWVTWSTTLVLIGSFIAILAKGTP